MLRHVKIWPGYNDGHLVQHADDQINDGEPIAGKPHEVPGFPIGNAIESYQGAATVQVLRYDHSGSSDGWTNEQVLYSERACQTLKVIQFNAAVGSLIKLVFRLRSLGGSSTYVDLPQYVYVAKGT